MPDDRGDAEGAEGFGFRFGAEGRESPDPDDDRSTAVSGERTGEEVGEVGVEQARVVEEIFIDRFEHAFQPVQEIYSPLDDEMVPAGRRDRDHVKRNRASRIVELMKRHRVYDRALLDRMPLDEISEFRVVQRRFFGGHELRVKVCAVALSPLEELVRHRASVRPIEPLEVEEAVETLGTRDDVFHYIGLLATTGFSPEVHRRMPAARNLRICLVEPAEETSFRLTPQGPPDEWGAVLDLFDPETDEEKVQRVLSHLRDLPDLSVRGGHVGLTEVERELGVRSEVVERAVEAILEEDDELSLQVVADREILKRKRL